MDNALTFTVVTVSFNNFKTISDTIESVLAQSHPNIEYLVIDGGSTDGTLELLASYGDRIRWISEPDSGIYEAMNKGWKLAKGDFIGFLNADDFYASENVITGISDALSKNVSAFAAYGDLAYVRFEDVSKFVRYWKSGPFQISDFLFGWMPPHPTFFLKREAFQQFGGFRNDALKSAADYELMLRMLYMNKLPAVYVPALLVKMRTGGESNRNLNNRIRGNNEDRLAWKINGLTPKWFTLFLKPIRKISQYWQRPTTLI